MRNMRMTLWVVVIIGALLAYNSVSQAITMDWVTVGDAGNANDNTGHGGVSHVYRIGKYEVTNAQYIEFLNAVAETDIYGLYNTNMNGTYGGIGRNGTNGSYSYGPKGGDSNWLNKPVNYVSWYDTLRFANWLHNGQGTGDTEDGAYNMSLGSNVVRKPGATVWLPSDNEWYKSAYYKGGGVDAGYWDYATQSNLLPDNNPPFNDTGNSANFYNDGYAVGPPYYSTDVGAYSLSGSAYNTYDQNGNIVEWNEAVHNKLYRVIRGGRWYSFGANSLIASYRQSTDTLQEWRTLGFRVASVPETNHLPVTDAGDDQTIYACIDEIAKVALDGSDSYDIDGDELTYYWSWMIDDEIYNVNGVTPTIELPVGEHVIELIVNDGIEDSEPNEVVVTVIDSIELLIILTDYILDLDLHSGIENSLLAKIDTAISMLENDTDKAATNSMQAFINAVEAQSGKKISQDDADYLIETAQQAIDILCTE